MRRGGTRHFLAQSSASALIGLALTIVCRAEQSPWQEKFQETWSAAQKAADAEDWAEAVRLYTEIVGMLGEEPVSQFQLARCLARMERPDDALRHLRKAVEVGFTNEEKLRSEEAFASLRRRGAFKQLFARIEQIAGETVVVHAAANVGKDEPAPLVIAFHGRGENPHMYVAQWTRVADELGIVVAAPRGCRAFRNKLGFTWDDVTQESGRKAIDVDQIACRAATLEAMSLAKSRYRIDDRRIVLAGYSQGGAAALAVLADDPARYAGAFVQATTYGARGENHWEAASESPGLSVFLLAHELDSLKKRSQVALDELQSADVAATLEIVPRVGHEPPPDNWKWQAKAIRHLIGP